ncbi:JmjC domain-containing protein [Erythrobacter sp. BLCC-B19]|uniref:JmjC domain-containing protein n=1 Tax=Erythrobacter sp. BLCC-B19 TaxID=3025315 RepID=UPI00235FAF0C|nr:cupin domain-containing protein [Erythrobacter sp. BLCC-B19]WDA42714.1 transcription factor jumonji, JmjC [Erythrobacter sp. BLCC-B19]
MSLIDPLSVPQLAARYPRAPGRVRHTLTGHRLLGYDALAEAARAMPPAHVETRVGNAVDGEGFRKVEGAAPPDETIAAGGTLPQWTMLRYIEQLPAYRALLMELLGELAPVIGPATGAPRDVKGFIFISGPGTHTPFHFDAEYNILFQIAGDKIFAAYPPAPPFLDLAQREAYHRAGENMLDWTPDFAAAGEQHLLGPGDALFVPHAAPHWVRAGDQPSVSLSVTWQCRTSRAVADALRLNPLLRRVGLPPFDPARRRSAPWVRAAAGRVGHRVGLL